MSLRNLVSSVVFLLLGSIAHAASLSVSPIRVQVPAPANSATVKLQNETNSPINVQIRIFKWKLVKGEDFYEEVDDVVATPPVSTLAPSASALVRILRTNIAPVVGEEAYRLIVDEIPDPNRSKNLGLSLALRYAIPVFFVDGDASQPKLAWSTRTEGGKRMLVAVNSGDRSSRVSDLNLDKTKVVTGLAGYVLGHSTRMWALPAKATGTQVSAQTDSGAVNATLAR